ncbi:MAG: YopX family protein [Lachnospira pectinoschiza]
MKNTDSRFLYKAKRKDNNEWIQGYLFKTGECYKILPTDFVSPALSVQEDTICQCTGMTANNYKLIFTNDIVEFQHRKNDKNPDRYLLWWNKEMSAMTAIDANKCVYDGYDYTGLNVYSSIPLMVQNPYGDFYDIKVIGNIIDNPELVKVKEDYSKSFLPKDADRKTDKNDINLEF